MVKDCRESREPASGKTGNFSQFIIFIAAIKLFSREIIFFCLMNYPNDSSTIPVTFTETFWSTSIEMISSATTKVKKRVSTTAEMRYRSGHKRIHCAFVAYM